MTLEIELKAHIQDFEGQKTVFSALGGPALAIEKADTYWIAPAGAEKAAGRPFPSGIRIRKEKCGGEERVLVTYKTKENREGIEINDEREFAVSDEEPFRELLMRMGFEAGLRKRKQGWSWRIGGITAELCRIRGGVPHRAAERDLGWFAELEILTEDGGEKSVGAARERLEALLEKANIPKAAVEARYYSEMLSDAAPYGPA
jgi:adenylate cyclase class 2